jgi:hypothetical protein
MNNKFLFSLSLFTLTLSCCFAQTIPNGSFEHWSVVSGVESPDGWTVSQTLNCNPLSSSKVTDKVDSTYAILLETSTCQQAGGVHEGFAIASFPIITTPLFLNGSYKSTRVNTDSSQVKVVLKKSSKIIGGATWNITGNVGIYTNFSIPMVYTTAGVPDEVQILIFSDRIGSSVLGNKLWIDKLTFSTSSTSGVTSTDEEAVAIYPNPAASFVTIAIGEHLCRADYSIIDALGRRVQTGKLVSPISNLDIESLATGTYLLCVNSVLLHTKSYRIVKH